MRFTRARIAAAAVIVGSVVVVAILVIVFVLTPVTVKRPVAPPSVSEVRDRWDYDILLPTVMPQCLSYDASRTGIVSNDAAINGLSLDVTLAPSKSGECSGVEETTIRISEAPAFESLSGNVTTVIQGRMQFARVVESTSSGQSEVTLQWRCASVMCRMTATLGDVVTEDEMAKMADSFQLIEPTG